MPRNDLQDLHRLDRAKRRAAPATESLGEAMVSFFKQTVQQRQTKLSKIAQCWGVLVPDSLCNHCVLHGLNRGTLTVLVDDSTAMYEVKTLLLSGVQSRLLLACRASGLRKIVLKPGRVQENVRRR